MPKITKLHIDYDDADKYRENLVYIGGGCVGQGSAANWEPRHEADLYETELPAIEAYLDKVDLTPLINYNPYVWDTGANDGRWGLAVKRRYPQAILFGNDIRPVPMPDGFDHWISGEDGDMSKIDCDMLYDLGLPPVFGVVIGNPPYKNGGGWVTRSLVFAAKLSIVSFLFPVTFSNSLDRYDTLFTAGSPISRIVYYNTRCRFSGSSGTYPMREYGQFEWVTVDNRHLDSLEFALTFQELPIAHVVYDRG